MLLLTMRRFALATAFLLAPALASAQNLVVNGGFETGDLSGFTYTGAAGGANGTMVVRAPFGVPRTGAYALAIGAQPGALFAVSQTFVTVPGQAYRLAFWEYGTNGFGALAFDGVTVAQSALQNSGVYREYVGTAVARGTSATVTLFGGDETNYVFVDDLSVTAAPEPATLALTAGGIAVLGAVVRRRRA